MLEVHDFLAKDITQESLQDLLFEGKAFLSTRVEKVKRAQGIENNRFVCVHFFCIVFVCFVACHVTNFMFCFSLFLSVIVSLKFIFVSLRFVCLFSDLQPQPGASPCRHPTHTNSSAFFRTCTVGRCGR